MVIYGSTELLSATPPTEKNKNMKSSTKSISITNYSHFQLHIISDTKGDLTTMPPCSAKSFAVNPSDVITFIPQNPIVAAPEETGENIEYTENDSLIETGLTMIAPVPLYQQDVTITNGNLNVTSTITGTVETNATITNASIPVTGNVNATIQNASIPVTGNLNANITNASIPVTGNVTANLAAGSTLDANITNASIPVTGNLNANITNASIPVTGNVTANLAAGSTLDANITNAQISVTGQSLSSGTLFNDKLTNANNWTIQNGAFSFSSSAGGTSTAANSLMTSGNNSWNPAKGNSNEQIPLVIQTSFRIPGFGGAKNVKVLAWIDVNNSYELRWQNDNNMVLYKTVNGINTAIISNNSAVTQTNNKAYIFSLSLDVNGNLDAQLIDGVSNAVLSELNGNDASLTSGFNVELGADSGVPFTSVTVTGAVSSIPIVVNAQTAIPIQNQAGGILQVGGTVNATITNASIPVTGNINATIQNASLSSNVINTSLATNTLVNLGKSTVTIPATNPSAITPIFIPVSGTTIFDNLFILIKSANNWIYDGSPSATHPYTVGLFRNWFSPDGGVTYYPIFLNGVAGSIPAQVSFQDSDTSLGLTSLVIRLPTAVPINKIELTFTNLYTVATVADNLTISIFGQLGNDTQLQNDYSPITYEMVNSKNFTTNTGTTYSSPMLDVSKYSAITGSMSWTQAVTANVTVQVFEKDSVTGLQTSTAVTPKINTVPPYGMSIPKYTRQFGDLISVGITNSSGTNLTGTNYRQLGWKR